MSESFLHTPSKTDKNVLAFSEKISPGHKPFYVYVLPESDFEPLQCFPNVAEKVRREGGRLVHGWEISEEPKVHLEAQFHAVWQSPNGSFLDVTPQIIPQSPILFLIDDHRIYTGPLIPDERFALGEIKLVSRYWILVDERMSVLTQMELAGFPDGHPAYMQRLIPLQNEIESIREKLQSAT
jgi:hypothetical protein